MRIAAIADIHGNIDALEAVMADIESRGVDLTVNLGDSLSGPLFPAECADRLIELMLPTIRGNHERQLLTLDISSMGASDRYASSCLASSHLDWIATLPKSLRLFEDVVLVHGTPQSDVEYFLESVDPGGLRPASRDEVGARAGSCAAKLILCGHTHLQRSCVLEDGRLVVNRGSVGLPSFEDESPFPHKVQSGSPHARYAILERSENEWKVQMVRVEYDWERMADVAEKHGRPDWAHALRTGL